VTTSIRELDDIATASRDAPQVLQPTRLLTGFVRAMRRIRRITERTDAITILPEVDLSSTLIKEVELRILRCPHTSDCA
jgi:hypothetical protein